MAPVRLMQQVALLDKESLQKPIGSNKVRAMNHLISALSALVLSLAVSLPGKATTVEFILNVHLEAYSGLLESSHESIDDMAGVHAHWHRHGDNDEEHGHEHVPKMLETSETRITVSIDFDLVPPFDIRPQPFFSERHLISNPQVSEMLRPPIV